MNITCPKCGADVSQSSGVVCPNCDHILRPGADSLPMLNERKKRHRGPALILSFAVPFFLILVCVLGVGAPLGPALLCGGLVGGVFLSSWLMASRVSQSSGGQVLVTILFFLGGVTVLIGLVVGGCAFLMRGMH